MQSRPVTRAPFEPAPQHSFEEKWELAQARYKGTIRTFARNSVHKLPAYGIDDIEQELLVVLWRCVMNYDPDKGASFNTLFQGSAKNRIISLIRTASTKSRTGIVESLDVDAVSAAVDEVFNEMTAEDTCLLRMELQEFVSEHGTAALLSDGRGRKPKRKVS